MRRGTGAGGREATSPSRPAPAPSWLREGASLLWLQTEEVDGRAVERGRPDQKCVREMDDQLRVVRGRADVTHGGTPLDRPNGGAICQVPVLAHSREASGRIAEHAAHDALLVDVHLGDRDQRCADEAVAVHPGDGDRVGVVRLGDAGVVVVPLGGDGGDADIGRILHGVGAIEVEARIPDREDQEEQQSPDDGELNQTLARRPAPAQSPLTRRNGWILQSGGAWRHRPVHPECQYRRDLGPRPIAMCEELVATRYKMPTPRPWRDRIRPSGPVLEPIPPDTRSLNCRYR